MNLKKLFGKLLLKISIRNNGLKNNVNSQSYHFLKNRIIFNGNNNTIIIGDNCRIENSEFYIRGNNNKLVIGNNVSVMNGSFWIEDNDNLISISDRTCFTSRFHFACMEGTKIIVGEDCLFASDITVRTGDSHSILNNRGKRINTSKNVIIGNHVWIGHHATLNKGSIIGNNSVIANNSVVTKSFNQSNVILGGVPARIIKTDITWKGDRINNE